MTLNAEQALIGALMINPAAVKDCGNLQSDMFTDVVYGRLYLEFVRAYEFGYTANPITFANNLPDIPAEELKNRLVACADASITSVGTGEYAMAIVEAYKVREASKLIHSVTLQPAGIEKQLGQLINELESVMGEKRTSAKSLAQIVDAVSPNYFTEQERPKLYTGFKKLDEKLGGMEGGDVIAVGARPAVGKSAFVTQMLMNMGQSGKRVLLYNLEMRETQVYERMLSRLSGIKLNRIRRSKAFLNDEKERFTAANERLKKLDIWISSGAKTVSEIRQECRNMGADCIIIDYLQLIRSERHYSNRSSEVGDISKNIKALAMEINCPVIVLSQLNRLSEGRETREPTMSELRESGDIEQDASVIILLWNCDGENVSRKGLKIEKNRQGERRKMQLEFMGDSMSFRELEENEYDFHTIAPKATPFD